MNRLLLVIFPGVLAISTLFAQPPENVVILVLDGLRYSEGCGDPGHQYIPHIWNELRPLGTLYTKYYNDGVTKTNSAHATILSGTWQSIANDGTEWPHMPTIFEYYRKERGASSTDTYVVLGKDKLDVLAYSTHPDYGSAYAASVKISASPYDDARTLENFREVALASHPRITIINMAAIDNSAHTGVWNSYVSSIRLADSLVAELWSFIQTDAIYKDKTTLFLTNDHGRHLDGVADGFVGHGDGCDGCRHISLLLIGPGTAAGAVDSLRREEIDIAPTVGSMLGFATPLAVGNDLTSAAIGVLAGWNMISLPALPPDNRAAALFPAAITEAFRYEGSAYAISESLFAGKGYWMRFPAEASAPIQGPPVERDTIDVSEGWNLIGTISSPLPADSIGSIPGEMTTSQFFGYGAAYYICDTLLPGRGYWVKAGQAGKLILSVPGLTPSAKAIHIIPIAGLPPPPPAPPSKLPQVPAGVTLGQNFPNPFNPSTIIRYQLPTTSRVIIRIYNTLGQVVRTLTDGVEEAGYRQVEWVASGIPTGVYFYRMDAVSVVDRSEPFTSVQKMLLVR